MELVGSLRMTQINKTVWIVIIPDLQKCRQIQSIMKNCIKLVHISGKKLGKLKEVMGKNRFDDFFSFEFWKMNWILDR